MTPKIQFPIKQLDDILGQVGKAKVISKLDLQSRFNWMKTHETSQHLWHLGKYRFTVMPFGLKCNDEV